MTTVINQGRRRAGLLGAMDEEWPRIVRGGAGRRAWRRWSAQLLDVGLELDGLDELVELFRHPGDHVRSDRAARLLIAEAQAGDDVAARVLMQGLVPFAGRVAALYARYSSVERDDIVAEVVAAVHVRIMRTRLDERDRLLVWYLQLTVRRQLARR